MPYQSEELIDETVLGNIIYEAYAAYPDKIDWPRPDRPGAAARERGRDRDIMSRAASPLRDRLRRSHGVDAGGEMAGDIVVWTTRRSASSTSTSAGGTYQLRWSRRAT